MIAFGPTSSAISSIVEFQTADPIPAADELLIAVRAVSINPVDTKIRKLIGADPLLIPKILGFDGSGLVVSVGDKVSGFRPGDEVFYSGDVTRPGTNAELHTVQAALVAHKPSSLSFAEAAALPLVSITAYELLFERMLSGSKPPVDTPILIINGAGGVGSALIPLARKTGLITIATCSRNESSAWAKQMGAHHVVNHQLPLRPQIEALGYDSLPLIANLHDTDDYWETTSDLLAPLGTLGLLVETSAPVDIGNPFRLKSPRIVWEYMPARSRFQSPDMHVQGEILSKIAAFCDSKSFPKINHKNLGTLSASTLQQAHCQVETSTSIGKITLDFPA